MKVLDMTQRYRKFRRAWGTWYAFDNATGNSVTLKTRVRAEAEQKVNAMNEMRSMTDTISGTAQPQITRQNLQHVTLPIPPIPLQREFARRVTAVEALKTAQRAALAELDAFFATLQLRTFRGEL